MIKKISALILILFIIGCSKKVQQLEEAQVLPGFDSTFIYNSSKTYSQKELKEYTKLELLLIKAEVFARHGMLKGNIWQKKYILSKKWFKKNKNASSSDLSGLAKKNLEIIEKLILTKKYLVKEEPVLPPLKEAGMFLNLKLSSKTKRVLALKNSISKASWGFLLKKEYGMEKRDPKLKKLLLKIKGYSGFYKKFIDSSGKTLKVVNYAGCCSIILSDYAKEIYIYNSFGNLIKYGKYYYADKEAEHFYFYSKNNKLLKKIILTYNIEKKKISEAEVYYE